MEEVARKLIHDLASLPEKTMRLELLGRRLSGLRPIEVAQLLSAVYGLKKSTKGAATVLSLLVEPDVLKEMLGAERYRLTYLEAMKLGLRRVSCLFTDLEPRMTGAAGYEREDGSSMELVELGRRRSLSKGSSKDTLDKLLSDPDPVVITNILNNPRITQREVVKIASMRPNSSKILRVITSHRKWSKDYNVKRAVVMNPYTPPRIAVALLEALLAQDISMVSNDSTLHPQVRLAAVDILKEKGLEAV